MIDIPVLIMIIALMLALLLTGVPIAFSLGITGILGIILLKGWNVFAGLALFAPYTHVNSWILVCLPLFVLMANYADKAGIADRAFSIAHKVIGGISGGLAMAAIGACTAFAAVTGSSGATAITIGKVSIPQMLRRGYNSKLATGCIAAGAFLGIEIPPSLALVIYGMIAEVSIGKLFIAVLFPGLITAALFIGGTWVIAKLRPDLAPPAPMKVTIKEKITASLGLWEVVLLFLVVIGGIYTGLYTVTEAAAIGTFAALVMLILHRRKGSLGHIFESMKDATSITAMVLTITMCALFFALFLILAGVGPVIAGSITSLPFPPMVLMALILLFYVPLGMFLDAFSMLAITVPVFLPLVVALGYDPIWFGVICVQMIEISMITPPVGINLFVVKSISPPDISLGDIFKGTLPYLFLELIVVALLLIFPQIALWLPSMMMT